MRPFFVAKKCPTKDTAKSAFPWRQFVAFLSCSLQELSFKACTVLVCLFTPNHQVIHHDCTGCPADGFSLTRQKTVEPEVIPKGIRKNLYLANGTFKCQSQAPPCKPQGFYQSQHPINLCTRQVLLRGMHGHCQVYDPRCATVRFRLRESIRPKTTVERTCRRRKTPDHCSQTSVAVEDYSS